MRACLCSSSILTHTGQAGLPPARCSSALATSWSTACCWPMPCGRRGRSAKTATRRWPAPGGSPPLRTTTISSAEPRPIAWLKANNCPGSGRRPPWCGRSWPRLCRRRSGWSLHGPLQRRRSQGRPTGVWQARTRSRPAVRARRAPLRRLRLQSPPLATRSRCRSPSVGRPTWRLSDGLLEVETPFFRCELAEEAGGCILQILDPSGRRLLDGPSADIISYFDSGGLWRLGAEFAGGSFREVCARQPTAGPPARPGVRGRPGGDQRPPHGWHDPGTPLDVWLRGPAGRARGGRAGRREAHHYLTPGDGLGRPGVVDGYARRNRHPPPAPPQRSYLLGAAQLRASTGRRPGHVPR